eukprot:CAMPEP_0171004572 /NCGR_PEP_ID=MMETSP0736-20130129/17766_1 /TAXON_ID=186038 /ORGANISM="Fragilariopsis kerguelensis, Strain L26-C5" /LENGTH=255 /DNA_ID=CAMNT_0011433941 /DNA_START=119 /DNA_END=886 /DNA_ORIENTATION=-
MMNQNISNNTTSSKHHHHHHKSIGKSSMTKNMATTSTSPSTAMMMNRSRSRSGNSLFHSSPLQVFPLPKSLFTISEDDNSNSNIIEPQQPFFQHNVFSLYDENDDDEDDDGGNRSQSHSTSIRTSSSSRHADILTSVLDTLSSFDEENEEEDEEEHYLYSSRHEVSRWNTGEYHTQDNNSSSCHTPTSRISNHQNLTSSRSRSCPLSSSSSTLLSTPSTTSSYQNRTNNNSSCAVVGIDRPPTRPTRSRRGSCQF